MSHSYGMDQCNAVLTPLSSDRDMLLPASASESVFSSEFHSIYRSLLGGLLYLGVSTRLDLSFSISALARHMHAPNSWQLKLLKWFTDTFTDPHLTLYTFILNDWLHILSVLPFSWIGAAVRKPDAQLRDLLSPSTDRLHSGEASVSLSFSYFRLNNNTLSYHRTEKMFRGLGNCYWEMKNHFPRTADNSVKMPPTSVLLDSTAAASLPSDPQVSARDKHTDPKKSSRPWVVGKGDIEISACPFQL